MSMLPNQYKEERPWGSFERFTSNEASTVKVLRIAAGKRLSLQKHSHRAEFWRVIEGSGTASVNGTERMVKVGDEVEVPTGAAHRLAGGPEGIAVLEIALGPFDEEDIERLEDDYGRAAAA
jgi:mannose-6-phosphate isomerase-like protein (cupin superfamily)